MQIGHCNNPEGANLLKLSLANFTNIKNTYMIEMGCALGVHAGPGSLSLGIQEIPND